MKPVIAATMIAMGVFGTVFGTSALAVSGKLASGRAVQTIGVQPVQPLAGDLKTGQVIEAIVVDSTKLKRHGVSGAKNGDRVTIEKLGPEVYSIMLKGKSGPASKIRVDQRGSVSPI